MSLKSMPLQKDEKKWLHALGAFWLFSGTEIDVKT